MPSTTRLRTTRLLARAIARGLAQTPDPAFRAALGWSLLLAATGVIGCFAGGFWLAGHYLRGWWASAGWLASAVGGALFAFYLYVPVAAGIAGLFTERIAAAVERRYYPDLPPARGASLAAQAWDGLALGGLVLLASLAGLLGGLVLPGAGVPLGWAIGAWAIGRGLFVTAAMRRAPRAAALAAYRARRPAVLLLGAGFVAASMLPLLNLAVPVLGLAMMAHLAIDDPRPG